MPSGKKVKLAEWPTIVKPICKSKEEYQELLEKHVEELSSLQQLHYASNRYALLLIFQGMDSAGKDGAIRHVMLGSTRKAARSSVSNSRAQKSWNTIFSGAQPVTFPNAGESASSNRSYYEEVLVVRVHPEILRTQGLPEELRDEKTIGRNETTHRGHGKAPPSEGTRIVKNISAPFRGEQRKRFLARIDEPDKNWKFSLADIHERKYWKDYVNAYESCCRRQAPIMCPGTSFPPTIRRMPA